MSDYYNAEGYGFWCGRRCVAAKKAAGIPPLGARKAAKGQEAAAETVLAQAALEAQRKPASGWSPLAVTGVVVASLIGIATMVVIIRRARK